MMATGLETVRLAIGKINVIVVVSGVTLKEIVKTVQSPMAGASGVFHGHPPGLRLVGAEEVVVRVTVEAAATVDHPNLQGEMVATLFKMRDDQEVQVTAVVQKTGKALEGVGDIVLHWTVVGARVLQLRVQRISEVLGGGAEDIVLLRTVVGATVLLQTVAVHQETALAP